MEGEWGLSFHPEGRSSPLRGWETEATRQSEAWSGQAGFPVAGPPACLLRGGLPGYDWRRSSLSPCPLGSAWSMTVRGTAVRMRPAWAASWHPWCRLPSTASTGPAAASWSSAATSRRPHPSLGPWMGEHAARHFISLSLKSSPFPILCHL